jgi:hypothetical protein
MTERHWTLGPPGWGWPDNVDKTGTENASGYRYLPVINTRIEKDVTQIVRTWQVARIFVDEDDAEMLEDAQLIAAAPKLLEAAKLLVTLEDNEVHDADTRWKTARNLLREAIAQAEGKTT